MCQFFSAIVTRDGRVLFYEEDSHETIVRRAGLRDDDLHLRGWVRVEAVPDAAGAFPSVRVDETSVPAWYAEDRAAWDDRVTQVAMRVRPALDAYDAIVREAWDAYLSAIRTLEGYVPAKDGNA